MLIRRIFTLVALATFAAAGAASAVTYPMSGAWYLNRGQLVDIPQNGGPVLCFGAAMDGCLGFLAPKNGGVPGMGSVSVVPTPLGTISVPVNAFTQGYPGMSSTNAVTFAVTVVQLATSFNAIGPTGVGVFAPAKWVTDPQQAGRIQANFSWCPGGPNPACTNTLAGVFPHRMVYTTNAAQ